MSKESLPQQTLEQVKRRRANWPLQHFFFSSKDLPASLFSDSGFYLQKAEQLLSGVPFEAVCSLPDSVKVSYHSSNPCYLAKAFTPTHLNLLGERLENCLSRNSPNSRYAQYWDEIRTGDIELFAIIEYKHMWLDHFLVAAFVYKSHERKIGPILGYKNEGPDRRYVPQIKAAKEFIDKGEAYDASVPEGENPLYRRGRKR